MPTFLNPDRCYKTIESKGHYVATDDWRSGLANFMTSMVGPCAITVVDEKPTIELALRIEPPFMAAYAVYNNELYYLNKDTPLCKKIATLPEHLDSQFSFFERETGQGVFIPLDTVALQKINAAIGHQHHIFSSTIDHHLGACGLVQSIEIPTQEALDAFDKPHYIICQTGFFYYDKASRKLHAISLAENQLTVLKQSLGEQSIERLSDAQLNIIKSYTSQVPTGFEYSFRAKLEELLQCLNQALLNNELTLVQKKAFAMRLFEERGSCHEGFHIRVGEIITELSLLDFNRDLLLARMRHSIVSMAATRSPYGQGVHANNRYFSLAALSGYGVAAKFGEDPYHGVNDDTPVFKDLAAAFEKEYQIPSILVWMVAQIKDTLALKYGYLGHYSDDMRACDFTSVSFKPTIDQLKDIPLTCDAAYVHYQEAGESHYFYINKKIGICKEVDPCPQALNLVFSAHQTKLTVDRPSIRLTADELSTISALSRGDYHKVVYTQGEYEGCLDSLELILDEGHRDYTLLLQDDNGGVIGLDWGKIKLKLFNVMVTKGYFVLPPPVLDALEKLFNANADADLSAGLKTAEVMKTLLKHGFFYNARSVCDLLTDLDNLNPSQQEACIRMYIKAQDKRHRFSTLCNLWDAADGNEAWNIIIKEVFQSDASKIQVPMEPGPSFLALINTLPNELKQRWLMDKKLRLAIINSPRAIKPYLALLASEQTLKEKLVFQKQGDAFALLDAIMWQTPGDIQSLFDMLSRQETITILSDVGFLGLNALSNSMYQVLRHQTCYSWERFDVTRSLQRLSLLFSEISQKIPCDELSEVEKTNFFDQYFKYNFLRLLNCKGDSDIKEKLLAKVVSMINYFPEKQDFLCANLENTNLLMQVLRFGDDNTLKSLLNEIKNLPDKAISTIFSIRAGPPYFDNAFALVFMRDNYNEILPSVFELIKRLPNDVIVKILSNHMIVKESSNQTIYLQDTLSFALLKAPSQVESFVLLMKGLSSHQIAALLKPAYGYLQLPQLKCLVAFQLDHFSSKQLLASCRVLGYSRSLPSLSKEIRLLDRFAKVQESMGKLEHAVVDLYNPIYEGQKRKLMSHLTADAGAPAALLSESKLDTMYYEMELMLVLMKLKGIMARFEAMEGSEEGQSVYAISKTLYGALSTTFSTYMQNRETGATAVTALQTAWSQAIQPAIQPFAQYKGWGLGALLSKALACLASLVSLAPHDLPKGSYKHRLFYVPPTRKESQQTLDKLQTVIRQIK